MTLEQFLRSRVPGIKMSRLHGMTASITETDDGGILLHVHSVIVDGKPILARGMFRVKDDQVVSVDRAVSHAIG